MKKQEKDLVIALCSFVNPDIDHLKKQLKHNATPSVLGQLFYNRMAGIAYGVLKDEDLLGLVNREFRTSVLSAYKSNIEKNNSFKKCLDFLSDVLADYEGMYAMLKGAVLCSYYPEGYRTSNDIDLLVRPSDVTSIGSALRSAGFKQGYVKNGEFVAASRQEIIESKMMRGETVPYILRVDFPGLEYLEVDINFSLDYKNGNSDLLDKLLENARAITLGERKIVTLDREDFFLHLCMHLFKEATTLPWVKMHRDMTLYKYCDIYAILSDDNFMNLERLFERATELGMAEECSCVIMWTYALFPIENKTAYEMAKVVLSGNEDILDMVISPSEHKVYKYKEHSLKKRFFCNDRINLLELI